MRPTYASDGVRASPTVITHCPKEVLHIAKIADGLDEEERLAPRKAIDSVAKKGWLPGLDSNHAVES